MELQFSDSSVLLRYDNGKQSIWPIPTGTDGILEMLQDVLSEARKAAGIDQVTPLFLAPQRPVQMASGVREMDEGDMEEIRLRNGGSALRAGVGDMGVPIFDDDNIPPVNWSA